MSSIAEELGIPEEDSILETFTPPTPPQAQASRWNWLQAPTGPGSVEDYVNHPLNFDRSGSLGQVLRGLTGLLGNLELAVADIAMGVLKWGRGRRGGGGE